MVYSAIIENLNRDRSNIGDTSRSVMDDTLIIPIEEYTQKKVSQNTLLIVDKGSSF
jgi:hypothetical protein